MTLLSSHETDIRRALSPAPEFESMLAPRRNGYLGADVAHSIPLNDGRVLWLFGDTLIGKIDDGERYVDAMPRNTVATQKAGFVSANAMTFYFADNPADTDDFFKLPASEGKKWFWPGTGILLRGELFVFGYSVGEYVGDCEALSFRIGDGWIMRVRDISGDPSHWKVEPTRAGFPRGGAWFCSAAYEEDEFLYLMGLTFDPADLDKRKAAVIGRMRIDELLDHNGSAKLEIWNEKQGWDFESDSPSELYEPGVTECSLYHDAPRGRYLATTYTAGPDFYITAASELSGPWTTPALAHWESASLPPMRHLSYTMRVHPELARNRDEMILTYVVNPRKLKHLMSDTKVYYPRFLRLDLSLI